MQHLSAWIGVVGLGLTFLVYAVAVSFWAGRLSQRVEAVVKATEASGGSVEKLAKLEVQMEHANASLDKLGREMEGVRRQLGNIAMGQIGKAGEL